MAFADHTYAVNMSRAPLAFFDLKTINQSFEPRLTEVVNRVVRSGYYVRGREVDKFEREFAGFVGTEHCVGVGNGFDALKLIFRAWIEEGVMREGDEVLVPANTYIATILAVTENRLKPVFVEPDIGTMNIDADRIEGQITDRTRAILVVHLYGRNAMTTQLLDIAGNHRLRIVEDNAQAAGCLFKGKRTGSLGYAAAHSFFPTKNLGALGDGGAVTTNDPSLAETIRTLGNYGSPGKGHNTVQGVNSRLDEVQAAVLSLKLEWLDDQNQRRRQLAMRYQSEIRNKYVQIPVAPAIPEEHVWHLFVLRCRERDNLRQHLASRGIETQIHYEIPPHRQPALRWMNSMQFPVTEQIHKEALSLPLHPALMDEEIQRVIDAVSEFTD